MIPESWLSPQVISTKAVLLHPQGLAGMYTEVLKFVPEYCSLLLGAWQEHGTPPTGSGFDFIVNAVWPEVVAMIDEKAAVIFAPGNPDTFHKVKFCTIAKNVSFSGFSVGSCINRFSVTNF